MPPVVAKRKDFISDNSPISIVILKRIYAKKSIKKKNDLWIYIVFFFITWAANRKNPIAIDAASKPRPTDPLPIFCMFKNKYAEKNIYMKNGKISCINANVYSLYSLDIFYKIGYA